MAAAGDSAAVLDIDVEEVEEALECLDLEDDVEDQVEAENSAIQSSIEESEAELAVRGMQMMMNNDFTGASEFFRSYSDSSAVMDYGRSFVSFVIALMSFDETELEKASKMLKECSKRCQNAKSGFKASWKRKFSKKSKTSDSEELDMCERLERRIIMADCQLYNAILTMTGMDISSYVKGGWALRKAWKIYEKTYKQIEALKDGNEIELDLSLDVADLDSDGPPEKETKAEKTKSSPSKKAVPNHFDRATLERLHGAVSYGYGMLQLAVSLTPPKILKLIELLGFEGDRAVGLSVLGTAAASADMRSPLAVLGLLWYHSMARSFLSLDGEDLQAGVPPSEQLMAVHMPRYPTSSLMLYYQGRIHRLKGEVSLALAVYDEAIEKASHVKELQLMCVFDLGWCYLMKLKWTEAMKAFLRLRKESRWSQCFYAYLCAICQGALGDVKGASAAVQDVPKLVKRRNSPIEQFVQHCAERFTKLESSEAVFQMLGLEVVYLWNMLPMCTAEDIAQMQQVCDALTEKKLFHHRSLLEGAICKFRGEKEMAKQFFSEAIARSGSRKEDRHVVAFATFEIACLHMEHDTTEATKLLNKVKDMKDFDFDGRLSVRVALLLKKLKREAVASKC